MDNLIKLRIPGERFWAEPLSENTAIIKNILTDPEYGLNDIVAHDGENVTAVLVKKTETAMLIYEAKQTDAGTPELKAKLFKVIKHFEDQGIEVEPAILGKLLIAIPVGVPKEFVMSVVSSSPVKVEAIFPEQQEDE